jgi:hypothetical protein
MTDFFWIAQLVQKRAEIRIPTEARNISLLHSIHIGSEAPPASYTMDIGIIFHGGKTAEV